MSVVPAVKGKIGNIEYYQCTMSAIDLISRTRPATEYYSETDWQEMGPWGRNQREVSDRYLKKITPYLLRDKNRFFNSFIVLLDPELCRFSSIAKQAIDKGGELTRIEDMIPFDRQEEVNRLGFLEIKDKNAMRLLDGQQRMKAIRAVMQPSDQEKTDLKKILEKENELDNYGKQNGVGDDLYSVLFIVANDKNMDRKIFEDLNSYAKPIGKKDLVMLSESNPFYKIVQNITKDQQPFGVPNNTEDPLIYMDSTSLGEKSAAITTLHHLSLMVEKILQDKKQYKDWRKDKPQPKEKISTAESECRVWLNEFFSNIDAYKYTVDKYKKEGMAKPSFIVDLRKRDDLKKWSLLFKPLPQQALVEAILFLKNNSDLDKRQIYNQINKIDWSYPKGSVYENMLITPEGNIQTGGKMLERLKLIILLWVLGKNKFNKLCPGKLDQLNKAYNESNSTTGKEFPEKNDK